MIGSGPPAAAAVQAAFTPGRLSAWARLLPPGGTALEVRPNRAVVGRSSHADVQIEGAEVSRRHALLWREAGGMWVADLGSSNGTLLNDTAVPEVAEVVDGDLLSFGGPAFVFRSV